MGKIEKLLNLFPSAGIQLKKIEILPIFPMQQNPEECRKEIAREFSILIKIYNQIIKFSQSKFHFASKIRAENTAKFLAIKTLPHYKLMQ